MMRNVIRTFMISSFMLFTSANAVRAQSADGGKKDHFFWLNFGLGPSTVDDGGGFDMGAAYQFGKNLLSLRITVNGELFGKTIGEYGLLYGYAFTSSKILSSFGTGVSLVEGSISKGLLSGEESEKIGPAIGLPLEAQLVWRPFHFMGIGLYGYADINSEESFAGAAIIIQIGKLR